MKREKRLTKRERKALAGGPKQHEQQHIHCVACGRHIEPSEFHQSPPAALFLRCQHGSKFASCAGCVKQAQILLDDHDRSGTPVQAAAAWH